MKKAITVIAAVVCMHLAQAQIGINTANPQGTFHIDAGKNNPGTGVPDNSVTSDDFIVTSDGSVGIGTVSPDPSAAMEIIASNKGVLLPKVKLIHHMDTITIPNPKVGTLIYNTQKIEVGGQLFVDEGYCFWDGTTWRNIRVAGGAAGTYILYLNSSTRTYGTSTSGINNNPIVGFTDNGVKPHPGFSYNPSTGTITVPENGDYEISFHFCETNMVMSGGGYDPRILGVTNLSGQWIGRLIERQFLGDETSLYYYTNGGKAIIKNLIAGQSYRLQAGHYRPFTLRQIDYRSPGVPSLGTTNATYIEIRKVR
ncbi:hypothetical protein [Chryseobacterium flavum]|uniref:hypothetical protein n=1 Tax=Chryseobacterium flavum TaxID=415851 RepID=UPI0028AEDBCF|nr:hypothetical protein [Chryseobacterium flavum]